MRFIIRSLLRSSESHADTSLISTYVNVNATSTSSRASTRKKNERKKKANGTNWMTVFIVAAAAAAAAAAARWNQTQSARELRLLLLLFLSPLPLFLSFFRYRFIIILFSVYSAADRCSACLLWCRTVSRVRVSDIDSLSVDATAVVYLYPSSTTSSSYACVLHRYARI